MPTMVITTTVSTVSMQRCVRARRRATTTTTMKMHRPAWRNGLNRPNIVAVASSANDDSWNAAIGKEKVRVTADERVVLFEFGVDPVRTTTTTTEVEDDETKMQKREEEVARADDEAFVESVVSLTAEQSQEEESVDETAVPKPKTTTTTTTTTTPSLSKMKKAELVALCEELGVDSTGTVPALRGRLGPVLRARAK
jgi:hypothetical protein